VGGTANRKIGIACTLKNQKNLNVGY